MGKLTVPKFDLEGSAGICLSASASRVAPIGQTMRIDARVQYWANIPLVVCISIFYTSDLELIVLPPLMALIRHESPSEACILVTVVTRCRSQVIDCHGSPS